MIGGHRTWFWWSIEDVDRWVVGVAFAKKGAAAAPVQAAAEAGHDAADGGDADEEVLAEEEAMDED